MNTQKDKIPEVEYALYFIYFLCLRGREGEVPMTEGGGG